MNKIIVIKNTVSFNTDFKDFNKSKYIFDKYSNIYYVFLLQNINNDKYIVFSDYNNDYNIQIKLFDIGIDTIILLNDSIEIYIKNFSGKFKPCSLKVFYEKYDTAVYVKNKKITLYNKDFQYAILYTNDYNKYNDFFYKKQKLIILILADKYERKIQNYINLFSSLYPDIEFHGALFKNNTIISSVNKFDGIIMLNKIKNKTLKNTIIINNSNIHNLKSFENWINTLKPEHKRIKNPFNSKQKIYKISFFDRVLSFAKSKFIYIILFCILIACLITLF